MDDVTQRNAGLVQSAAKASADLEGHLTNALRTMGVFKLRDQQTRAAAKAPRREAARERRVESRAPVTPPAARRAASAVEEWSEF
ncbi:hypothetical protein D3C81_2026900 [compost metagenome]